MITTTKTQLVLDLAPTAANNPSLRDDMHQLLTVSKRFGYIRSPNLQQVSLNNQSFERLQGFAALLTWINEHETANWRTRDQLQALVEDAFEAVSGGKPLTILAFLCPSYRKGIGEIGFNTSIGETTKRGIATTFALFQQYQAAGIPSTCTILFSDLVLENIDKMDEPRHFDDLTANIQSARTYAAQTSRHISFQTLSEFPISRVIGRAGIRGVPTDVDQQVYQLVLNRNMTFYRARFGWSEGDIRERTNTLACTYPVIGNFFRATFNPFVLVYTANSFERSSMYQGKHPAREFPIFYPRKPSLAHT